MDNVEVPEYFICPISLGIMKDPVTIVSGITYDRESIQRWLSISNKCPVTMQRLPTPGSDLITPNNTLSRMVHEWCSVNGLDIYPIPTTPKPPPTRSVVASLVADLRGPEQRTKIKALEKLEALASESDRNRVLLGGADLTSSLVSFVITCYERRSSDGLREALSFLFLVRGSLARLVGPLTQNSKIIESLLWVLGDQDCFPHDDQAVVKPYAAHFLSFVVERASPSTLDGLTPEFFRTILTSLRPENLTSHQAIVSLLNILLETCLSRRNRDIMIGMGAVSNLVEVEMRCGGGKKATELVLGILCYLCSSTDGRAQLVDHPSGISVVTKRILKVSPVADDSAVFITWLVSRYLGTSSVLREMMRVGTVAKLCMVMQANCDAHLKAKAKDILRAHSDVWKGSGIVVKLLH